MMEKLNLFLNQTNIIRYNAETCKTHSIQSLEEAVLTNETTHVEWVNTFGLDYPSEIRKVIQLNKLDDFFLKLMTDQSKSNRVIELGESLFLSAKILKTDSKIFDSEQMYFILSPNYLWSIQEKKGDYFDFIRERLHANKGLARKKKADYLLYLILESIIDNYQTSFETYAAENLGSAEAAAIKPTPEFSAIIEQKKQDLFIIKKATGSLRDMVTRLEKIEIENFKTSYFSELKNQSNNLLDDIDFELHQLESSINLVFSMQGHRLNEVMKTLTILSAVFIPLTFIAGIYGMNFINIPELQLKNGYFLVLAVMSAVTLFSIWYFKRKKWF